MKQVILHKIFFVWDYDKEELWLDEMSRKGLQLVRVGIGRYVFEEDPSRRCLHRLDLLKGFDDGFIPFLEETGIEFLCSFKRWGYFRRDAAQGEFQLYSDAASKIKLFNRILLLLTLLLCMSLTCLVYGVAVFCAEWELWVLLMPLAHLCLSCLVSRGLYVTWGKRKKLTAQRVLGE